MLGVADIWQLVTTACTMLLALHLPTAKTGNNHGQLKARMGNVRISKINTYLWKWFGARIANGETPPDART